MSYSRRSPPQNPIDPDIEDDEDLLPSDLDTRPTTQKPADMRSFLSRLKNGPPGHLDAPPMDSARRRALIFSYLPDWIITIVLFVVFFLIENVAGFKRAFSVTDTSIQYTYAVKERVPFWLAGVYAGVIPAALIVLIGLVWRRSFYDVHAGLLGLVLSLALTTTLTDTVKISVGRPRPDLIDRCQLVPGTENASPFGLVTVAACTQTDMSILNDGFKSFFSGHSSFSFSGLGFLAFYLAGKMHLFDHRGHAIKAWIVLAPLVGAAMIAISRTMDYRHHWQDVLVGSLVGFLMSWFVYRLYYPSLVHAECEKPYAPRIPAAQRNVLPLHKRTRSTAPPETVPRSGDQYGSGYTDHEGPTNTSDGRI